MDDDIRSRQLDQALTAMQRQGASPAEVLAEHPELEAELRPLLEEAERLRALSPDEPRRVFVVSTKHRLMNQIAHRRREQASAEAPERRRLGWLRQPALAFASLLLAVVLLLSMTGIVYASSDSLPGDPLYGVKRGVEQARLGLAFTEETRIDLLQQYVGERLGEIQALDESDRSEGLATALNEYESSVDRLVQQLDASSTDSAMLAEIESSLGHHTTVLESLLATAPEAAQPGLRDAAEKSAHGQAVIQALQEGKSPSELAPGRGEQTETPGSEPSEPGSEAPGDGGPDQTPPGQDPDRTPPGLDPDRTPGPPEGAGTPGAGSPDN